MGKLFVIMGKSATGKDTLYKRIKERHPELKEIVTYTTRPIRKGETYGKEYFFVSKEEMYEMKEQGKIIECRQYNTVLGPWFYFTADDGQIDLSTGDYLLISTLAGYEKLQGVFGIDKIVPVYIEVDDVERLERAVARERRVRVYRSCAGVFWRMKKIFQRKNCRRQASKRGSRTRIRIGRWSILKNLFMTARMLDWIKYEKDVTMKSRTDSREEMRPWTLRLIRFSSRRWRRRRDRFRKPVRILSSP